MWLQKRTVGGDDRLVAVRKKVENLGFLGVQIMRFLVIFAEEILFLGAVSLGAHAAWNRGTCFSIKAFMANLLRFGAGKVSRNG